MLDSEEGEQVTCDEISSDMRRRLNWHRLSPFKKFKFGRFRFSKLFLQTAKLVLITAQAILFVFTRSDMAELNSDAEVTFKEVLESRSGDMYASIYTRAGLSEFITLTYETYLSLKLDPVRKVDFIDLKEFTICFDLSKFGSLHYNTVSVVEEGYTSDNCIIPQNVSDVEHFITRYVSTHMISRVTSITLTFDLPACKGAKRNPYDKLICAVLSNQVILNNMEFQGIITPNILCKITRVTSIYEGSVHGAIRELKDYPIFLLFTVIFAVISITSAVLSIRSCLRDFLLLRQVDKFFIQRLGIHLSLKDKIGILDPWLTLFIASDLLSLIACVLFPSLFLLEAFKYDAISIIIGLNCLLVWVGILRYFSYLDSFNSLLLIIKRSAPTGARFTVCVIILFCGFVTCSYVTIGPYHTKFNSFLRASGSLFGLMNGDEIYTTFQLMDQDFTLMLAFSRIFLALFMLFFMYTVVNTFLAILNDYGSAEAHGSHISTSPISRFLDECHCHRCSACGDTHKEYHFFNF